MKLFPVGAELLHADGQTDVSKLIVVFRNFAKAPKKRLNKDRYTEKSYLIVYT